MSRKMQSNNFVTEVVKGGNTSSFNQPAKTWELTLNNYTDKDIEWLKSLETKSITISKEVGENGTKHLQGKITFKRAYRLTGLKKLNSKVHWEKSVAVEDANYCRKIDSEIIIDNCNRSQGARTDLDEIKKQIMEGKTVDEIVMETPMIYHQYGRTLQKIEDICKRNRRRDFMTEAIWYYGKTGVGKSHKAYEYCEGKECYEWINDGGWWDTYDGQEVVIMNDFRGEIPYNTMLQLVDKWNTKVRRRGREPINFTSKMIIITSSLSPEEVYRNRNAEDKIEQLLRRIKVIEVKKREN